MNDQAAPTQVDAQPATIGEPAVPAQPQPAAVAAPAPAVPVKEQAANQLKEPTLISTDDQKGALQLYLRGELEIAQTRRTTHKTNATIMKEDRFIQALEFLLTTVRQLNLDRQ